jgi:uncharacterized membrane protein
MYFGLTSLGVFHTILSLLAVVAGAYALIHDRKISWNDTVGKVYIIITVIVCISGFGIFQHGGFGKPHALGVITLIVICIAFAAGNKTKAFGWISPYVETVCYSMTFFFHVVPGITETATRLPYGAPFAESPEDPTIQMAIGVCFILFLIGAIIQVRSLRAQLKTRA